MSYVAKNGILFNAVVNGVYQGLIRNRNIISESASSASQTSLGAAVALVAQYVDTAIYQANDGAIDNTITASGGLPIAPTGSGIYVSGTQAGNQFAKAGLLQSLCAESFALQSSTSVAALSVDEVAVIAAAIQTVYASAVAQFQFP